MMEKYVVSLVKSEDVESQVKKAIDLLGGMGQFVKSGHKVLIKPNMTGPATYDKGVTTNPKVVETLVQLAQAAGASQVDIGDGTGSIHIGSINVLKTCGMGDIARKYGCELVDLNKGEMVNLPIENGKILEILKVNKRFLEYDVTINVPVLKTHFITGVSLGMKNLKGCIPPSEKRRFHDIGVSPAVADLGKNITTTLTVIDGTVAGEGLGPKEGNPVGFHVILAGKNTLAVDAVGTYSMGFDPYKIDHLRMAAELGAGSIELSDIKIVGDDLNAIKRKFAPAVPKAIPNELVEVFNYEACSGCIGCATITISRLNDMGFVEYLKKQRKKLKLVIGTKIPKNIKIDEDTFVIGNCAMKFKQCETYFPGCAPSSLDVVNAIIQYYDVMDKPFI